MKDVNVRHVILEEPVDKLPSTLQNSDYLSFQIGNIEFHSQLCSTADLPTRPLEAPNKQGLHFLFLRVGKCYVCRHGEEPNWPCKPVNTVCGLGDEE